MVSFASVEALVVSVSALGHAFADGDEENELAKITNQNGVHGIGECVATPPVTKAMSDLPKADFWSQGIQQQPIGRHPFEATALYDLAGNSASIGIQTAVRLYDDLTALRIGAALETQRPWANRKPDVLANEYERGMKGYAKELPKCENLANAFGLIVGPLCMVATPI